MNGDGGARVVYRRRVQLRSASTDAEYSAVPADAEPGGWRTQYELVDYAQLPTWLRDNPFVLRHYRSNFSLALCAKSMVRLHNETVNIWSHLIGLPFFFIFYNWVLDATSFHGAPFVERVWLLCYLAGASSSLLCSGIFHTCLCHSRPVSLLVARLDYTGIALLVMGALLPGIWYGYRCFPLLRLVYLVANVAAGIATLVTLNMSFFYVPANRWLRSMVFAAFIGCGTVPSVHALVLFERTDELFVIETHLLLMYACIVAGGAVYCLRIPERWWPGAFDIWGHSHQLWHVFSLVGAVVHAFNCERMFRLNLCPGRA